MNRLFREAPFYDVFGVHLSPEMMPFAKALQSLLQLKYTHRDVDFCNTHPPINYKVQLLEQLLKQHQDLDANLRVCLEWLLEQFRTNLHYPFTVNDAANAMNAPVRNLTECQLKITPQTDLKSPTLCGRILAEAGIYLFLPIPISIQLDSSLSKDIFSTLPRYLAMVLILSGKKKISVQFPEALMDFDSTPFKVLVNLFSTQFILRGPPGVPFNTPDSQSWVTRRLLYIEGRNRTSVEYLLTALQKSNLKRETVSKLNFMLDNIAQAMQWASNGDTALLIHLNKARMRIIAQLAQNDGEKGVEFDSYLQSVSELTMECSFLDKAIVLDIFNDSCICNDLHDILSPLMKKNERILPYLRSFIAHKAKMKGDVLPSNTSWESILLNRILEQSSDNPINLLTEITEFIPILQGFPLRCAPHCFSLALLLVENDQAPTHRDAPTQLLLGYLQTQAELPATFFPPLKQLLTILVFKVHHWDIAFWQSLIELCRMCSLFVGNAVLREWLDELNASQQPNQHHDSISVFAITWILGLFAEEIIAKPHTPTALKSQAVPIYLNLLYHHWKSFYSVIVEKSQSTQSPLDSVVCVLSKGNALSKDFIQVIYELLDCYESPHVVQFFIRFRSLPSNYAEQFSEFPYSHLINKPRSEIEPEKSYRERLTSIIMLITMYDLGHPTWVYYLILMGNEVGPYDYFCRYKKDNLGQYCQIMLEVWYQFQQFGKINAIPLTFLIELFSDYFEASAIPNSLSPEFSQKISSMVGLLTEHQSKALITQFSSDQSALLALQDVGFEITEITASRLEL